MTGYGRASGQVGRFSLTVQVSSVNRKTLDLSVTIPTDWESLEAGIGEQVRQVVSRGKVHVSIEVTGAKRSLGWDESAVAATLEDMAALAARQGIPFSPTPELLWDIVREQRTPEGVPAAEDARTPVFELLTGALGDFVAMRAKEGGALLRDFVERIAILATHIDEIAARAPQVAPGYREVLMKRLRDAGLELDVSDERVLREIALFADRSDITEELTRLRSHLQQLQALLQGSGEVGRKAEFILQEIGREVHTIGSKANDLAISRHVIELKNELERVREQIANVE